jgi:Rab3 GTPase-activating protein regulatory subunit N-terminus
VLLIDLESRQIIRIWKGYREAQCCWHQTLNSAIGSAAKPKLHLVIHSRQRRIIDVWRVRHGALIMSKQVGRDAQLVSCSERQKGFELTICHVLHSNLTGTFLNQIERINLEVRLETLNGPTLSKAKHPHKERLSSGSLSTSERFGYIRELSEKSVTSGIRIATLRLQHLQQLLSSTNVEFTLDDVFKALQGIKALVDLSAALDLLATASILEECLGAQGSSFHKNSLSYCSECLQKAIIRANGEDSKSPGSNGDIARTNFCGNTSSHVKLMTHKIVYHNQVRVLLDTTSVLSYIFFVLIYCILDCEGI